MKIINSHSETVVCPPEEELEVIRHSAAHIMAQAIQHLWPEADFAFGPATDKGFYYDVDLGETKLTDEDLQRIEDEMRKIVKENLPFKSFRGRRDQLLPAGRLHRHVHGSPHHLH